MPRKIRDLESELAQAGFSRKPGKGSHRKWQHPLVPGSFTMSGNPGDDAAMWKEQMVREWIGKARTAEDAEKRKQGWGVPSP